MEQSTQVHKWKAINIKLDTKRTPVSFLVQPFGFYSNLSGHVFEHCHLYFLVVYYLETKRHMNLKFWRQILITPCAERQTMLTIPFRTDISII